MKLFMILMIFHLTIAIHSKDMDSHLKILLTTHPEIKNLDSDLKSKKANAYHETTYPDPKIGVAFRNYPTRSYSFNDREFDTPSMTGIEYSISQEIPFPGKLTLQGKVSKLGEVEFAHYARTKKNQFLLEYLTQLTRMKNLEKKIAINTFIRKTLESQKVISSSTFATGNSALSKTLKLQIEVTLSEEREIEFTREKKNILVSLDYFHKNSEFDKKILESNLNEYLKENSSKIKNEKIALKQNLVENPNYKLALISVERANQESKLSSLLHAPDTEIFFAYMKRRNQIITFDNGPLNYQFMDNTEYRGDLFSVGVNVRVPVWSFLSKHHLDERSEENKKSKTYEVEKNKLFLESNFEKLISTLESLENQIQLYEKKLIPELNKSLSALSSEYASGKINLLEVLGTKIELQKTYLNLSDLQEKKEITTLLLLELTNQFANYEEN